MSALSLFEHLAAIAGGVLLIGGAGVSVLASFFALMGIRRRNPGPPHS